MRNWMLLLMLVLASQLAVAQNASVAELLPQPTGAVVAETDTAAALHRLFATKRANRTVLVIGTVLAGGLGVALDEALGSDHRNGLSDVAHKGQIIGLTLVVLVAELLPANQYSQRNEELALLDWKEHRLSPRLRRRLKPDYFLPRHNSN